MGGDDKILFFTFVLILNIFIGCNSTSNKNGISHDYYPNGVLKDEGLIKNGKRVGLWKTWNESGKLYLKTTINMEEGMAPQKAIMKMEMFI